MSVQLGAHCDSNCYWNPSMYKSHTIVDRTRAFTFLHELGRTI